MQNGMNDTLFLLYGDFTNLAEFHTVHIVDWGTEQEIVWKENFRLWMEFVNEYKNRGGRVTLGSDAGYIYKLYGFGYIQEMELMREAGFSSFRDIPISIIRRGQKYLG